MKTIPKSRIALWMILAATLLAFGIDAAPLGTAFTYQGRLTDGGSPANGSYDLRFILNDAESGGGQVGSTVNKEDLLVTNGVLNLDLDFGPGIFTGPARWLEIGVRPANSTGAFTVLNPRQLVTAAPYAFYAPQAGTAVMANSVAPNSINAASLADGAVTGPKIAVGQAVKALNGLTDQLTLSAGPNVTLETMGNSLKISASPGKAWQLGGNTISAGDFLGTVNDEPLEFKVGLNRALRLEPNAPGPIITAGSSPNIIGGSSGNFVAAGVAGATVFGGGSGVIGGKVIGATNAVAANFGTVSGGLINRIETDADGASIGGGSENTIKTNAVNSTVGGGRGNTIQAGSLSSTIGGGNDHTIQADTSTIAGGHGNAIQTDATSATIGGGILNTIQSKAFGGTIGGGGGNIIQTGAVRSTIGGGEDNRILTNAVECVIGGGNRNTIGTNAIDSVIAGGEDNGIQARAIYSTIGGGNGNIIQTNAIFGTIGGGMDNRISPGTEYATVPGGQDNVADGNYSFAAGRRARANHNGAFVWADSTDADFASGGLNQFLIRASGGVGIGQPNPAAQLHVASGGGINRPQARLQQTTTGDFVRLRMGVSGSPNWDIAVGSGASPPMNFYNGSANVMVISYSGVVTATSFNSTSDRNAKEGFADIDGREILARLAKVPVQTWHFKQDRGTRHIGPMAQDFHAAFGVGTDDKHISTVDADGVALAAIQGLYQLVQEQETEIKALKQSVIELKQLVRTVAQRQSRGEQ